jgi:hypothetical protein
VLPDGGVLAESVTEPDKHGRRYRTTAIHLAEPNYELLARVFIHLARQELAEDQQIDRAEAE